MKDLDKIKEQLIKLFKEKHESDKTFDASAKGLKDPFFTEFENEINEFVNKDIKSEKQEITNTEISELFSKETVNDNEQIKEDLKIKDAVTQRVKKILEIFDINLYKNVKIELVKIIIKDIVVKFKADININNIKHVENIVNAEVDSKFNLYFSDKDSRQKTLLYNTLNTILSEVDEFFKMNTKEKLSRMSLLQKNNLIKFFLMAIDKKFLNEARNKDKMGFDDYEFIKKKIKFFILHRYEKTLKGD